jgi:N-acetyltransferase 10
MMQDVHERFRTESHTEAAARFNERFLLSIASCKACVVMDDELNILPISSHIRSIKPVSASEVKEILPISAQNHSIKPVSASEVKIK